MHHRLRTLRTQRGLTLRQVSERTGLAISTLHEIEKREREVTLTTALKLACFLRYARGRDLAAALSAALPRSAEGIS